MNASAAIGTITGALEGEPKVKALLLSGSYGLGLEDEYSDIDFVAVIADGYTDAFVELWRDAVCRTGEIVLWWDRQPPKANLVNAITEDWLRIDVEIVTPDQMSRRAKNGLRVLFDYDRILDTLPDSPEKAGPDPRRWNRQFENFIRILGLMPLAIGRHDYVTSITGVTHLRSLLIELLVEETGAPNRGGALHLNRLITEEQKELLESLPPLVATRDAAIEACVAYASAYLPRARGLAKRFGVAWPERFEAATWRHLKSELFIERPASG